MTALKLKNYLVSYIITNDKKFLVMTNNEFVVELLKKKVELRFENHSYHALVDELPIVNGIEYKQYKLKPIPQKEIDTFEVELQRLKDIEEALIGMQETLEAQEELIKKMVKRKGLKLKPHLPNDSLMFSPKHKERVHIKTSLRKIIDQEAIESMMKKHPQLGKCFKKRVRIDFDRQMFEKIQKTLPAEVINKIVSYDEVESMNFYELENYECSQCGGVYTKKGVCKYCGQNKTE